MRWVRRLGMMLMVVVGLGSIGFYVVVAGVVNAQPTTQAFDGWVAVLQKADEPFPEQITLLAMPIESGAPGDNPLVRYSIIVCGSRPFRGVLLIGGQARLEHPSAVMPSEQPFRPIRELRGASLAQFEATIDLGPVQFTEVSIEPSGPCVSERGGELLVGTPYDVQGRMRGPIQHRARFMGVDAARLSQVWPRVGGLAQVPDGNVGVFYGRGALKGSWMIPPGMRSRVTVGSLKAKTTVDVAVPPLPDVSTVKWDQAGPIAPSVRLTDVDEMASAQNLLITAGIALGIGGSLLASLLFEVVRGRENVALPPCADGLASPSAALPPPVPALLPHPDRSRSSKITPASCRWAKFAVVSIGLLAVRALWRRGRR